jgi:hypothetical protein
MTLRTCVAPHGWFEYGLHQRVAAHVKNLRQNDHICQLGRLKTGQPVDNRANFPAEDLASTDDDFVYEISNAFPFNGVTYIKKSWADAYRQHPQPIGPATEAPVSFVGRVASWLSTLGLTQDKIQGAFEMLPQPLLLALAVTSSDARDLVRLAHMSCEFTSDAAAKKPAGLSYCRNAKGHPQPCVKNRALFEAVANNSCLPDSYKEMMVLRPGVQGSSEIVGDVYLNPGNSHVFEYMRRNSYIPCGHFAANMAHDAVRYRMEDLTLNDLVGMRHLYYQRTYVRMAQELKISLPASRQPLNGQVLEQLRQKVQDSFRQQAQKQVPLYNGTLWGWNFGFDYAPSGYRLHASHQQVHQQFALIPSAAMLCCRGDEVDAGQGSVAAFAYGDLISEFSQAYFKVFGKAFFQAYLKAIYANRRMDGDQKGPHQLVVYEDDHSIVFVPKAQTAQMELQLMTKRSIGNILEADADVRASLDRSIFAAVKVLARLGARMITSIEASKRFDLSDTDQHLMYIFLPKSPESPRSFTQAQLRWICGHYPEDFAAACRQALAEIDCSL